MKIAVCFPGDMSTVFMSPFFSMVNIETPEDCEVRWFRGLGWCQARRRIHACEQGIDWGADLIAELDIDQTYDPDVLKRLLARINEGYKVIAAMVPCRGFVKASKIEPFQRLAWHSIKNGKSFHPVDPSSGDIQECVFPTSACVMFRAEDLKKLRKPWYFSKFKKDDYKQTLGEDGVWFYRMKTELGIKCYVDTTIKVNHCHVFEIDETFPERFADWAEDGKGPPSLCNYE